MRTKLSSKIQNTYGSKSGFLAYAIYFSTMKLGAFRRYKNINFGSVRRIIFVCSGNICRSPLAEVAAKKHGIDSLSFGLHCRGGDKADQRAVNYAKKNGLNLEGHITKNIGSYTPIKGDLIVGMEPHHINQLKSLLSEKLDMTLAGLWLKEPAAYIHDPYNTNEIYFEKCEKLVIEAAETLANNTRQLYDETSSR